MKKISVIILSILIALTLAFIWGNSVVSSVGSSTESSRVHEFISKVIGKIFGEGAKQSFQTTITIHVFRKMAHAFEFFILGLEINLLFVFASKLKLINFAFIFPIGYAVGGIDEIIQLFNDRGSSFVDTLIDFSGFALITIIFLIIAIVKKSKLTNK